MDKYKKIGGAVLLLGVLALVFIAFFFVFLPGIVKPSTNLKLGDGDFKANIALNEIERTSGLSGVTQLPSDKALILAFRYEDRWKVWMKDMVVPIDIVWLNKEKKVIYIVKNASPKDSTSRVFEPNSIAKYVIELPAGTIGNSSIDIDQVATFQIKEEDIK